MSLFSPLRDGFPKRNRNHARKARRGLCKPRPARPKVATGIEGLEVRMLLSARVVTDLPDYAPGSTAIINAWNDSASGTNFDFDNGETLRFQVTRTDKVGDSPNGNLPWFVTDGVGGFDGYYVDSDGDGVDDYGVFPDINSASGVIQTSWFVESQYANSSLLLTATGQTSKAVATTEFTDGTLTVNQPSDISVAKVASKFSIKNQANPTEQGVGFNVRVGSTSGSILYQTPSTSRVNLSNGQTWDTTWDGTQNFSSLTGNAPDGNYVIVPFSKQGSNPTAEQTAPTQVGSLVVDRTAPTISNVSDSTDPFSPNGDGNLETTTIRWTQSETATITIQIFNGSGTLVRAFGPYTNQAPGTWSVSWDGKDGSGTTVASGIYTYRVDATDQVGNAAVPQSGTVTVDRTAPASPATVFDGNVADVDADYTNASSSLAFNWTASTSSDVVGNEYAIGTSPGASNTVGWTNVGNVTSATSIFSLVNGTLYYVSVRAYDSAGNRSSAKTSDGIRDDRTPPTIGSSLSPLANANGWNNSDVTVTFSASDGLSGIASLTAPQTVSTEGIFTVVGTAIDGAGNSAQASVVVRLDKTAPKTTATLTRADSSTYNPGDWTNQTVTVSLGVSDALSGVATSPTQYSLDGGSFQAYTAPFTVSTQGTHSLIFRSTDRAGNTEADQSVTIKIDTTNPTISGSASPGANSDGWNNTDVSVSFNASDNLSGIASTTGGTLLTAETPAAGTTVTGTATDGAGNTSSASVTVKIDRTAPETSLPATPPALTNKTEADFTLGCSDNLSGVKGFEYSLDNGPWTFTASTELRLTGLTAGARALQVRAVDAADNRDASPSTFSWTIDTTPVSIGSLLSPTISYGTGQVTFSGTVTAGALQPTGSMAVTLNGVTQAATLDASGGFTTTFTTGALGASGTPYSVDYRYSGDGNFGGVSGSSILTVNKANQAIAFGPLASKTYGDADFTLDASGGGSGNTVTFSIIAGASYAEILADGHTVHIVGATPAGQAVTVRAAQTGDANYNAASDADQSFTIDRAMPTVSVVSITQNAVYNGLPWTTTGTVTGVHNDSLGAATIGFPNDGPAPVNAGQYTVIGSFAGSTNYLPAQATGTIVIGKATPTIGVGWAGGVYTAQAHAAGGAVTGVTVNDVTEALGTPTFAYFTSLNGQPGAPLNGAPVNAGDYVVVASYAEGTNYVAASTTRSITITRATPTVSVVSITQGAVYNGQAWTTTGTVGGVLANGVPEDLGAAAISYPDGPAIHAGTYDVTGSFAGNENYTDASGTGTIVVGQATPAVRVTWEGTPYDGSAHPASATVDGVPTGNNSYESIVGAANLLTFSYYAGTSTNGTPLAGAPVDAGTYTVRAAFLGNTDYATAFADATVTIAKATATISVVGFSGSYDGNPHGVVSRSASGVHNEAPTGLVIDSTTYTNVPGGPVHWTFSNPNYEPQSGDARVTIDGVGSTTAVLASGATYDGSPHGATASWASTGVDGQGGALTVYYVGINGTAYAATTAAPTDAGEYRASASYPGDVNHTGSSKSADFTIGRRAVTVTADPNQGKIYGNADPVAFAYTVGGLGLATGDNFTGGLYRAYGDNVGGYAIDRGNLAISDGNGGNNYSLSFTGADFVITARPITVSAVSYCRTYDGTANSSVAPKITEGSLAFNDSATWAQIFDSKNVGSRTLSVTPASVNDGNGGKNYIVSYKTTTGTISKATLDIYATTESRQYDGTTTSTAKPTPGMGQLKGTDTVTDLAQSFGSKDVKGTNGSTLLINAGYSVNDGNAGGNYDVVPHTAAGTITPAALAISAVSHTKTYDGTLTDTATPTYQVTGRSANTLFTGDGFMSLGQSFVSKNVMGTNGSTLQVGYGLNDGNGGNNYSVTTYSASGTINRALLTITAASNTKVFDTTTSAAANPMTNGLQGSDTAAATEAYTDPNAGTGKTLVVASYTVNDGNNGNNYTVTTVKDFTGVINERDAYVRYIGQTAFMTSGSSSTTAQVTLTASLQDTTGVYLSGAKVDFIDDGTGTVLARGVTVTPVAGKLDTGTANAIVTLSTGQNLSTMFLIRVVASGNYNNDAQVDEGSNEATVVLSRPAATNQIIGGGTIDNLATVAGTLGITSKASCPTSYSIGVSYNKSGTNLQGQVLLSIPQADGSVIYIKSNSLTSMAVNSTTDPASGYTTKTATLYTKASVYKIKNGVTTTIEGNVSLRADLLTVTDNLGKIVDDSQQVGFTVLSSKDSKMYYSNNWVLDVPTSTWKTQTQKILKGSTLQIN